MDLFTHKEKSVDLHNFAMIPKADIPRSSFMRESTHKTTFDAGYLIPIYHDEVLPGDSFSVNLNIFARLATTIFPIMDNMTATVHFFFTPNRLTWTHWVNMQGEQANPADSISYTVPTMTSPAGGYAINTLHDYFGLPVAGQMGGASTFTHDSLHLRAYNLIWNTWYRDENLQNSVVVDTDDGPDTYSDYVLLRRGKRHDYFTSALPWPQKGATAVSLPLGTSAPVRGIAVATATTFPQPVAGLKDSISDPTTAPTNWTAAGADIRIGSNQSSTGLPAIYADLTSATAATINQIRLAFQTQKILERDARGGTRYTEIIRSHFGVISPDARLQRPEYLGGGSVPVVINPTVQTSGTSASGTTTPMGTLAGVGATAARNIGFTQSFTEHGVILGLLCIDADLTYQQGVRRMWNRQTRYDFYLPAFAAIGEQAIYNQEIYVQGTSGGAADTTVFGYQEAWGDYRYKPSLITGQFRSTYATPLDGWHLAQKFTALPTLNSTFIQSTPPVSRVVAAGAAANGAQFLADIFIRERLARPMPMYGVPGLIDHF